VSAIPGATVFCSGIKTSQDRAVCTNIGRLRTRLDNRAACSLYVLEEDTSLEISVGG
jgi:hypothetical protein